MKVLLGHTFYRSSAPSGEDAVYRNERRVLEERGIEVIPFEFFNDDIDESTLAGRVKLGLNAAWSRKVYRELSALLRATRPDVAHFHNIFPLISPSAYAACREQGVPVVQTLHNYRFVCPQAMLQRNGRPCEKCLGSSALSALKYRCYRSSFSATLVQVLTLSLNRLLGSYGLVNRYVALTDFAAGKLAAGGLPKERLTVRSNFLPDPPEPGDGDGGYAVYTGRLSQEKGVLTLLRSWKGVSGLSLKIVGDGPLRRELEEESARRGLAVEFTGRLEQRDVLGLVARAAVQIVPSEWYEGFPMVILEAFACGTPVIASRIGGLPQIVEEGRTGLLFEPGNAGELACRVRELTGDPKRLSTMRSAARALFEERYTEARGVETLLNIYQGVIDGSSGKFRTSQDDSMLLTEGEGYVSAER